MKFERTSRKEIHIDVHQIETWELRPVFNATDVLMCNNPL
jgi:hypothetical protein